MQLVLLAAGFGRRFGGLKQLAPVGPNGEAVMDYTAFGARRAGFDEVILIVREEVQDELLEHIEGHWPDDLRVTPVVQGPVAGTTQAVASAAPHVTAPFGVANADDLYGDDGLATLASEVKALSGSGGDADKVSEHVIVAYRLADTIIGDAAVTRGICRVDDTGHLTELVEHTVCQEYNGFFLARPLGADPELPGTELTGDEETSMNLWGFSPAIFGDLDFALAAFDPSSLPEVDGKPPELLLPSVVGELVAEGRAGVRVTLTKGRCIGITHPDDLPVVRKFLAELGAPAG